MYQAPECASCDWSLAPEVRTRLSCLRWEFVWTLICLTNDSPDNTFFWQVPNGPLNLLSCPRWARASNKVCSWDSKRYGIYSTATIIFIFSLSSRLQAFRCKFFELSSLGRHSLNVPIVRFRLPSYSVVSLCVRWIRCEWRTTKRISYWISRSTSLSALATMAISSSASTWKV
jgi:hypothetical protein